MVCGPRLDRLRKWKSATGALIRKSRYLAAEVDNLGSTYMWLYHKPREPAAEAVTSSLMYLQLHRTWFDILLGSASVVMNSANSDQVFDGYTNEFEEMLNLAEAIVKDHGSNLTPLLSFDTSIVLSVYFAALKSRPLRLRRRAIEILKQTLEHEGLCRRETVVRHAEWKLQIEEKERGSTLELGPLL